MAFETSTCKLFAAFLISLIAFSGCTKTDSESSAGSSNTEEKRPSVTGKNTPADDAPAEKKENTQPTASVSESSVQNASISDPAGNDFLLYFGKVPEPVVAEDYEIGELLYSESENIDERAVYRTVSIFLNSVLSGESFTEMLIPEKAEFIKVNTLDADISDRYTGFRIGYPDFTSTPVSAAFRLFGENITRNGEIYLEDRETWKIYDFQIEPPQTAVPEKSDSFEPVEYGINKKRF